MVRLAAVFLLALSLRAETRAQRIWKWSAAAMIAGASADVISSYGHQEANPLYRSPNGQFGARGLILRGGIVAGGLVVGSLVMRKHPYAYGPAVVNFGAGYGLGVLAIRNHRVTR